MNLFNEIDSMSILMKIAENIHVELEIGFQELFALFFAYSHPTFNDSAKRILPYFLIERGYKTVFNFFSFYILDLTFDQQTTKNTIIQILLEFYNSNHSYSSSFFKVLQ